MSWAVPVLKVIGPAIAGSVVSSELNKPSGVQRAAQQSGAQAADAQSQEIQDNLRRKRELEAAIKALKPLTKEQKEALFQIRPGKSPDFGPVGSTRQLEMLQQLIGGIGQGSLQQGQADASRQDLFSQQQNSQTVNDLVQLLLGLGPGGGGGGTNPYMDPSTFGTGERLYR